MSDLPSSAFAKRCGIFCAYIFVMIMSDTASSSITASSISSTFFTLCFFFSIFRSLSAFLLKVLTTISHYTMPSPKKQSPFSSSCADRIKRALLDQLHDCDGDKHLACRSTFKSRVNRIQYPVCNIRKSGDTFTQNGIMLFDIYDPSEILINMIYDIHVLSRIPF